MNFLEINNTNVVIENIEDTPRCAIYLYLTTDKKAPFDGAHVLLGNLLLQGTKTKTAEQIATELENLGIEVSIDSRSDYLKISIVCLNEDLDKALEIVDDFVINSTFETFDKEVFKFKNETISSLDSPVTKASDAFYKEIFKNHKYGITNTKILETIDNMTIDHVKELHQNLLNGKKIISIAATMDNQEEFVKNIVEKLSFMQSKNLDLANDLIEQYEPNLIKIAKDDAKQAQIFQGWIVPTYNNKDCAKLSVLNNILGASGLSSRMFVELRDKQGLAYTVRSQYKTMKNGAYFMLYIGTEPSNIQKSLNGFKSEIQRLIDEPPNNEELTGAIENYIGKFKYFYTQTNAQIASSNGINWINNLGFDYNEKLIEEIKNVTSNDIVEMAKKYLQKEPVTVVLAPSEFLNF